MTPDVVPVSPIQFVVGLLGKKVKNVTFLPGRSQSSLIVEIEGGYYMQVIQYIDTNGVAQQNMQLFMKRALLPLQFPKEETPIEPTDS